MSDAPIDVKDDTGTPPDAPPLAAEEGLSQDKSNTNASIEAELAAAVDMSTNEANNNDTNESTADDIERSRSSDDGINDDVKTDNDSDDNNDREDGDDAPTNAANADDLLLQAMSHKEDGNAHFKSGDYTAATRSYRRGTNTLKNLNNNNTGDDQVKQLLITLQTNLSMVCYKQSKHKMSRDVATKAIEIESTNVKALYRRAMAHRAMGDVDSAKDDLRLAYKTDPTNTAVKKEFISIKKILEERKSKEKARLQKAFNSNKKGGSSLLYSDKEEEETRKVEEKLEKERKEKEAVELRKKEWEDECVKRMASDPPEEAISFDEWDKQRREREEEKEKARKKAKKAEEDLKREERRKAKEAENNKQDDSDDDDELTEQELAMLRGYKKTSDGRTTSYFNREQTEHEKALIGCIAPKKLDASTTAGGVASPSTTSASSSGIGGASVWNASGTTWEEKDTTDWCKKSLEQCLLDSTSAYFSDNSTQTYVATVKKVTDLTGDASVAIVSGKKRYIYDFHVNVEYEIVDDAGTVIASGVLKMPEVHSANTSGDDEELEVEIMAWKSGPNPPEGDSGVFTAQDCMECRKLMVSDVRKSVLTFVQKFNANF